MTKLLKIKVHSKQVELFNRMKFHLGDVVYQHGHDKQYLVLQGGNLLDLKHLTITHYNEVTMVECWIKAESAKLEIQH